MKITDKTNTKVHRCGCLFKRDAKMITVPASSKYGKDFEMERVVWSLKTPCEAHRPNFQKKADKLMRRRDRRRGRGWTKTPRYKVKIFNRSKRRERQKIM